MLSFTYNYKQPDQYHFSLDSIHLAKFVATEIGVLAQNRRNFRTHIEHHPVRISLSYCA